MSIKFHYFDGRGIGEPIRWIMAYGGIPFEDIRIPYDDFPPHLPNSVKEKCRWGQVPLLEFEGKTLTQSLAVSKFVAKKAGLVPADDYHQALCDEFVFLVKDIYEMCYKAVFEEDANKKAVMIKETLDSFQARYFEKLEAILQKNGGKYLVGNCLTWADIYLTCCLDHFKILLGISMLNNEKFPLIAALLKYVTNETKIKEWLQSRPNTPY